MWTTSKVAPLASALLLTAVAVAQEPPRRTDPTRPDTNPPSNQQTQAQGQDRVLAAWLVVDNQNEIALSQLAISRAQSAEVKQFAQRMVEDHGKMLAKLQALAGGSTTGQPADASGRRDGTTTGTDTKTSTDPKSSPETPTVRRDPTATSPALLGAGGQIDVVSLKQELGQKCLASARQLLEAKSGAEFDKCFMMHAVGAHVAAVDTIDVFRKRATGELRKTLDEALPTVQSHLDHAKNLAQKSEANAKGDAAKRGDGGH